MPIKKPTTSQAKPKAAKKIVRATAKKPITAPLASPEPAKPLTVPPLIADQPKPLLPSGRRSRWKMWLAIISPIIIVIGLYFAVYPFWPRIQYALFPPQVENAASLNTNSQVANADTPVVRRTVPTGNKIIIPKIGVEMTIVEGTNEEKSLNLGAWRMPQTSTPDIGGNTVITAHRFKYKPPSKETFYLLDKLVVGDTFTVNWQGLEYIYRVSETKIVEPTAIEVLYNTQDPQITLITCTPLFTTKQRLIVIAKPI